MANEGILMDDEEWVWSRPTVSTGDLILIKRCSPSDPVIFWEEAMGIVRSYEWDGFDDCGWVCLLNSEGGITHHALEHPYIMISIEILEPAPEGTPQLRCDCPTAYKSWVRL